MFKEILVPTDLSERTDHALAIAEDMARRDKNRIHLLHVIETLEDTSYDELRDFYRRLEKRAQKAMEKMIAKYALSQISIEPHMAYGKRTGEILRFAEVNKIDLIVMNSHAIDPDEPSQGWGTISHKVGILANCPVMLVK